jgi:hypothetical protein
MSHDRARLDISRGWVEDIDPSVGPSSRWAEDIDCEITKYIVLDREWVAMYGRRSGR